MKLSEKHRGLRIGLALRQPVTASDSDYKDFEKIIIELYDGVALLEAKLTAISCGSCYENLLECKCDDLEDG